MIVEDAHFEIHRSPCAQAQQAGTIQRNGPQVNVLQRVDRRSDQGPGLQRTGRRQTLASFGVLNPIIRREIES